MTIAFESIHPMFAARVSGVDLSRPLPDGAAAELEDAMARYAVLVFNGQDIDDEQQVAFSRTFGNIEDSRGGNPTQTKKRLDAQLNDVSNLGPNGKPLAVDDRRRAFNLGNHLWHTDSSFRATPAKYSLLSARRIPSAGGNTEFADMRAAYDALDRETQTRIEGLICEHSLLHSRARLGFLDWSPEERAQMQPVLQSLVRTHPISKRKSLFIASHAGKIVGWSEAEAKLFLLDLMERATQRAFVYVHEWSRHDLVMWDNRCVLHRARAYDPTVVRDMRRTTVAGDEMTAEQLNSAA
ncbi:MAG: TauD/TfdA family dioxygenase [Rhodospirillaceae bacterium]|nr:TauD/TfdA family dioxygenase [Rhodospirillaceae bacterium]MDD9928638.1 TauD/TfdA family dioxygenase [Rhodospirillaceae bacterium]